MLNLERFEDWFQIQISTVKNGEDLKELEFTRKELEEGHLSEIFKDENVLRLGKDVVLYENIICNVFVNGIMVKDLKNELNI